MLEERHILGTAVLTVVLAATGTAADRGNFLLCAYGKLILLRPNGTELVLADHVNDAAFSPDGAHVAFTDQARRLFLAPASGGNPVKVTELPAGGHFEDIGWAPDGSLLVWQAIAPRNSSDLFAIAFPLTSEPPRRLGHWYQNFSFSPDGKNIVHAVNEAQRGGGLETLEVATGRRTLIHRTKDVVWDAHYSPSGRHIAYRMTIRSPNTPDDEPDCTPPTLGLFVYSIAERRAFPFTIGKLAPGMDNVSAYSWSPDSSRLALVTGTTDCDSPGESAVVFVTGLDLKRQSRVSDSIRSLDPVFAPDGSALAYVDVSDLPAKLMRYDLKTGARDVIWRAPEDDNYFRLLGWK